MAVLVTPWSVAPDALPGPHGEGSVPNICEVAAAVVDVAPPAGAEVADALVPGVELDPRPLLQAATMTHAATAMTTITARWFRRTMVPPCPGAALARRGPRFV